MRVGLGLILAYIFICPLTCISIRYLVDIYDTYTILAGRFIGGSAGLLLWVALQHLFTGNRAANVATFPKVSMYFERKALLGFLLITLFYAFGQLTIVKALEHASASITQIITLLSFPLTVSLGAFFFPSERKIIGNRYFQIGSLVAVSSTLLAVLASPGANYEINYAAFMLLLSMASFSVGTLISRHLVDTLNPIVLSSIITVLQATIFVSIACSVTDLNDIFQSDFFYQIILFGSGAVGMCAGVGLCFKLLQSEGVIVVKLVGLCFPVVSLILEYLLLGDILSPLQMLYGTGVIIGCALSFQHLYGPQSDKTVPLSQPNQTRTTGRSRLTLFWYGVPFRASRREARARAEITDFRDFGI